jgi:uncharacterized protein HemX
MSANVSLYEHAQWYDLRAFKTFVADRLVRLAGTKLQYHNDLPTAAVAMRVFLALVEKV